MLELIMLHDCYIIDFSDYCKVETFLPSKTESNVNYSLQGLHNHRMPISPRMYLGETKAMEVSTMAAASCTMLAEKWLSMSILRLDPKT